MANEVARSLRRRMTTQETRLWVRLRALRAQDINFRRQVPIESYIVDFACLRARLVAEVDGSQHGRPDHQAADVRRDETLRAKGYAILRFWNAEIDQSASDVAETVFRIALDRARERDLLGRL